MQHGGRRSALHYAASSFTREKGAASRERVRGFGSSLLVRRADDRRAPLVPPRIQSRVCSTGEGEVLNTTRLPLPHAKKGRLLGRGCTVSARLFWSAQQTTVSPPWPA